MKNISISHRYTDAVLFTAEVADDDAYPIRTALKQAIVGDYVYRCTTRHTGWSEGFATHSNIVHPRCDVTSENPDPDGTGVGCCCVAPNWGPLHKKRKTAKKRARAKARRKPFGRARFER